MCLEFARSLLGVDSGLTPGLRSQFGVAPEFARSSSGDHAGLSELARIINSIVRPHGARHHSQFTAPWQLAVCHRHFALVCLGTHLRSHLTLLNTTVRGQILTAEHMRVLKTKLVQWSSRMMNQKLLTQETGFFLCRAVCLRHFAVGTAEARLGTSAVVLYTRS